MVTPTGSGLPSDGPGGGFWAFGSWSGDGRPTPDEESASADQEEFNRYLESLTDAQIEARVKKLARLIPRRKPVEQG